MKQDRWPAVAQLLCLIASMLASFILCFWMSAKQPTQAYYLLPSRFWQLMSGAVLLVVHDHGWLLDLGLLGSLLMELVAIICIGLAVVYTPGDHGFPLPWSLLGIVGALATIAAGRPAASTGGWRDPHADSAHGSQHQASCLLGQDLVPALPYTLACAHYLSLDRHPQHVAGPDLRRNLHGDWGTRAVSCGRGTVPQLAANRKGNMCLCSSACS